MCIRDRIYATTGTAHMLNHNYVGAQPVPRPGEDTDELAKLFDSGKIRLIIATPTHGRDPMRAGFRLRRMAVEYGIACVTSIDTAKLLMKCVKPVSYTHLSMKSQIGFL